MNPELEKKLTENRERREREAIFSVLPEPLKTIFSNAEFFPGEDISHRIPAFPGKEPYEQATLNSEDFSFADFDSPADTCEFLGQLDLTLQPPVLCQLRIGPLFRIGDPFEVRWLAELFSLPHFWANMVEEEQKRGVVCREYIGYLEPDRVTNNKELVFEVFCFHHQ